MTTTATPVSERIIDKVRALIAKANATEFAEEAEAFFAKAQEFITRYEIDAALLRDADPSGATRPCTRIVSIVGAYATARGSLLHSVARSNGVKCITLAGRKDDAGGKLYDLVGFESDIDLVELFFTELDLYLARQISQVRPDRYESVKAYRASFALGFAGRIGSRFIEAKRGAEQAAKVEQPGVAVALYNKDAAVAAEFAKAYPRVRQSYHRASSGSGYRAGAAAANGVSLSKAGRLTR